LPPRLPPNFMRWRKSEGSTSVDVPKDRRWFTVGFHHDWEKAGAANPQPEGR
jgi:hypothetical protein